MCVWGGGKGFGLGIVVVVYMFPCVSLRYRKHCGGGADGNRWPSCFYNKGAIGGGG